jgi:hypothetical protein
MRRKYAYIGIILVMSAAVFVVLHGSQAETLRVVGFNVEYGHADPAVVDDSAARLQDVNTCGFSGVQHATREQMCGQKHGQWPRTYCETCSTSRHIHIHQRSARKG